MYVVWLIFSMLLAILAAAGPSRGRGMGGNVTVILDRGITMSPRSERGQPFRGVLGLAGPAIARKFGGGSVDLMPVPGDAVHCGVRDGLGLAGKMAPTAVDTRAAVEQAIAGCMVKGNGPIVVLTDRELTRTEERVVQIPPEANIADIGIADVAARQWPVPQVMVRLRNQSRAQKVGIKISSGETNLSRVVDLPPAEQTRNYFFDLPKLPADAVMTEIQSHDEAPVDDRAWLVRVRSWPRIEARSPLPAAVVRMISSYSKLRPAGKGSSIIAVSDQPIGSEENGVSLVGGGGEGSKIKEAIVIAHPITGHITRWPAVSRAGVSMPQGFRSIVRRGNEPLVGVRDEGVRQVWINLAIDAWSSTPDFVIFFADVFDWVDDGSGDEFAKQGVVQLPSEWVVDSTGDRPLGVENGLWPGLYRRPDGALQAMNAPDVTWNPPPVTKWQAKLASETSGGSGQNSLQSWFCMGALACALLAAMIWR